VIFSLILKRSLILFACILLVACHRQGSTAQGPSDVACKDEISTSVMRAVTVGDWNSVNVYRASREDLDRERAEIDRVFAWSRGIQDKDVRDCYEHWLWFFDYELDDAYAELDKQDSRQRWEKSHEIPVPPERGR